MRNKNRNFRGKFGKEAGRHICILNKKKDFLFFLQDFSQSGSHSPYTNVSANFSVMVFVCLCVWVLQQAVQLTNNRQRWKDRLM